MNNNYTQGWRLTAALPLMDLSVDNLRLFMVYASLECAHTVTCVCSPCPQVLAGKNSYNVILARQPLQVELTHLGRFARTTELARTTLCVADIVLVQKSSRRAHRCRVGVRGAAW